MKLYSVRDVKAAYYVAPFCAENDGIAMRLFENEVRHGGGMPSKFPFDFELFRVGLFDPQTGEVTNEPNEVLANGAMFSSKELFPTKEV